MSILLIGDKPPRIARYQERLGLALARVWTREGHDVHEFWGGASETIGRLRQLLESPNPYRIHLLSCGPAAQEAARLCGKYNRAYTSTSVITEVAPHQTRELETSVDVVHANADAVIAPSTAACERLVAAGVSQARTVTAGVDTTVFQPRLYGALDLPRPITLALLDRANSPAIRLFVETNLPGTKLLYSPDWTGPSRLEDNLYVFSYLRPTELANVISTADTCVVPEHGPESLLLALQSLACGVPVAACDENYAGDVLNHGEFGAVHADFGRAITRAWQANRQLCRSVAQRFSWQNAAHQILRLGDASRSPIGQPA